MSDAEKRLNQATEAIREEIDLLLKWSEESLTGGWSTHQVTPQRDRAAQLALLLYRLGS